jgi:hypothetical protein
MIETDLSRIADALEGILETLGKLEAPRAVAPVAVAADDGGMGYDELRAACLAAGKPVPKGTKRTTLLKWYAEIAAAAKDSEPEDSNPADEIGCDAERGSEPAAVIDGEAEKESENPVAEKASEPAAAIDGEAEKESENPVAEKASEPAAAIDGEAEKESEKPVEDEPEAETEPETIGGPSGSAAPMDYYACRSALMSLCDNVVRGNRAIRAALADIGRTVFCAWKDAKPGEYESLVAAFRRHLEVDHA